MKAVAALVAIALLLLLGPLTGPALAALPAPVPSDAGPLRLEIEELGPRVVTADGPTVLSLVGNITNTGTEPVAGLGVRLQRSDPLTTEGDVRDALRGAKAADAVVPQFVDLPGELAPGARAPLRLSVALRGTPAQSLALSRPGVYELLLNVNGVPAGGERARLAVLRMLLPVLSLPAPDGTTAPPAPPPSRPTPVPFTLLYPVTDPPRRLPTVPGEPALLTDDELAGSFAPGGRLHGLVTALAERAPTGSGVRSATCLAVDADLVATAAAMRDGYEVRGPDGVRTPGSGAAAAGRWLELLATTARGGCVLALPYADADLVALTRGDLDELAARAVVDGRVVLAEALGTPVLTGLTWPADGVLDERTLARAVAPHGRALVLSTDGIAAGTDRILGVVPVAGGEVPQLAVLTDPLLTRAASGPAPSNTVGTTDDPSLPPAATPAGTGAALATQDVIGAIAFRARTVSPGADPLVVAPAHQWTAGQTGAADLLTSLDQMVAAGVLLPRPLEQVISAGPVDGARRLAYPLRAGAREIPPDVVATVAVSRAGLTDLRSAAVEQGSAGIGIDDVFAPLQQGLVRAASAAWRGRADVAGRFAGTAQSRLQELRAAVRVLEPPGPYALGTSDAPLLLTIANALPISMRVRVELASSGGLTVAPIPEQVIPPLGRRQVEVSAEVTRAGQFVVDAAVRTPDGGQLGPASRLRVRSTAYGTITVWLTGTAGVLLVLLAARRVLRRVRRESTRPPPNSPNGATEPLPRPESPDPGSADPTTPLPPLRIEEREHRPALKPPFRAGPAPPQVPTRRR